MTRNGKKYQIASEFQEAIRNYLSSKELTSYQFCAMIEDRTVKINPAYLSHILTGRMTFALDDSRVKRIAESIRHNGPCFVVEQQTAAAIAK